MLNLKQGCKYALVAPTSIGVRIQPIGGAPVHASDTFLMQVTSAETNVASVPAYLGLPVKILTAFVKDSPIAARIKSNLRSRGMDYEGKDVEQGGPWGYRHQFNIADSGFGPRAPRVHNDRAGEVGLTLQAKDFDLDRILGQEGAQVLHLSGLVAALSKDTGAFCIALAEAAKKHGTRVSFDLNYRETLWKGRETELRETFANIVSLTDILVGNEEDCQLALGVSGPEAGGKDLAGKTESFKAMIGDLKKTYPNTVVFANTLRQVVSANRHLWGALMMAGDTWYEAEPREIDVLDRIGGGDGFVGGLLYGMMKGWEPEKWLQFGWATGALAATLLTDYGQPADEAQVWSIWQGNARVRR